MVIHQESSQIVATAMALHDHSEWHPFGGELAWLAGDPAHAGKTLGMAVSAAVTARLIDAGYRHIHLYTEHWRLAAPKTYLKQVNPLLRQSCPSSLRIPHSAFRIPHSAFRIPHAHTAGQLLTSARVALY
jgi:hypothetical protein